MGILGAKNTKRPRKREEEGQRMEWGREMVAVVHKEGEKVGITKMEGHTQSLVQWIWVQWANTVK